MTVTDLASSGVTMASEDELVEWLHDTGRTDGLPVVLPTRERVEEMLLIAAFAGMDRSLVLGDIGPNMGAATVEKIAVNAVMAGCLPEYFPIVIAAVRAICDPRLDIAEVQATTHELSPLLIVNGPVSSEVGIASSYGALGTGHRANLTIGRAVRLCMINLGGGRPGLSDMALLGHPGKISYCLAENADESPFPPLHTTLGFEENQSAVTVTCVSAPRAVFAQLDADDPDEADRLLEGLARTIATVGTNNAYLSRGTVVVCINPDHAALLARAGHTRHTIQRELWRRATNPRALIEWMSLGRKAPTGIGPDEVVHATSSPESILMIVAGGGGLYSAVMTPWAAGPHQNTFVTVEIVTNDSCEAPLQV